MLIIVTPHLVVRLDLYLLLACAAIHDGPSLTIAHHSVATLTTLWLLVMKINPTASLINFQTC
jgi:hypothetical protein